MPLARSDVFGRNIVDAIHVDYSRPRGSAWIGAVEGIPRLGVVKGCDKNGAYVRWSVDGKALLGLDAALAVFNGEKTLEVAVAEAEQKHEQKPAKKISLAQQIEEVEREIAFRKDVYARKYTGREKSKGEFHLDRMKAVLGSLRWLSEHELVIKHRLTETQDE